MEINKKILKRMDAKFNTAVSVCIVMATFNGERYLTQQLESILHQTWENISVIICDDSSTDNTQNIIREFAEKDNRLSYVFNKENVGVNKNFEIGFLKSHSDFIAIADQDDIWKEDKIDAMMKLFSNEKVMLVHSASVQFSEDKLPANEFIYTKQMSGNDPRKLVYRNSISGHNIIFRKELLKYSLPIPTGLYYDWWLAVVATCVGTIEATREVLAYQRKHDSNVTLYNRTTNKQTRKEYLERRNALEEFVKISFMQEPAKTFSTTLLERLKTLEIKKFSWTLFIFLLKNSSVLFYYKSKKFPFFSYLKTAYRMSFGVDEK